MTVPTGWTVAIDTATPATVAAAIGPDGRAAARIETPAAGERPAHTRRLLPLVEDVLRETGGSWRTIERVVVGLGPGTFTGIRVGVATARGLVLASGATIVGVPTPAALAFAAQAPGGPAGPVDGTPGAPVLVVQDARRKEYFLTLVPPGTLPDGAASLCPWTAPQTELAAVVAGLPERPRVAVGDGAWAHRAALEPLGIVVPEDPAWHAVDGLALAGAAATSEAGPVDAVRPLYVRDPDAIPTAERR